jgi:alpha-amylase
MLVDVAEGAGIGAWDLRASRLALASVMRRRPEAYHAQLRRLDEREPGEATAVDGNPHEQYAAKEGDLARALTYDDHERRSGLVRLLDLDGQQVGDFVNGPWQADDVTFAELVVARAADGLEVRKSLAVGGGKTDPRLTIRLDLMANVGFSGTLELEMNLNLAGGGGNPEAYYRWAGHEQRFDSAGSILPGVTLSLGNQHEGVDMQVHAMPGAELSWSSIDTVSNSEAGFERVHQGSCLVFRWPIALGAAENRQYEVEFVIAEARDRSAEEAAALQAEQ